jgi:hypothetical protein
MTLLFNQTSSPAAPAVHILIVAVGRYPYLQDGARREMLPNGGLGQLESPVPSAEALYRWIKTSFNPHKLPIGSIEVLASQGGTFLDEAGAAVAVEAPTLAKVRRAARAWAARANQHENNFTLFYFCGHGVSSGLVHSLLLEDFGKDVDDPFNTGALDAVQFMDGLRSKAAKSQLFLIDACRSVDYSTFSHLGELRGASIISAPPNTRLGIVEQACLWATALGALAYGKPGEPSVFMSAMLHAMQGGGAEQDRSDASWVIRPDMLKMSINHVIQRIPEFAASDIQYATLERAVKGIPIHKLKGKPSVPVDVTCNPPSRNSMTAFTCSSGDERKEGTATPWYLDLKSDKYTFNATAVDIDSIQQDAVVHPPGITVFLPDAP